MAKKNSVDRRTFLKSAATGGAALVGSGGVISAQQPPAGAVPTSASAPIAPRETDPTGPVKVLTTDRPGGDFMVDVLKTLNFEYLAANPGSSFRGIQESLINYGGNRTPEFLTCCHEESSVAFAHGYYKVEGKPMAVLVHGTVGLQHASMAIYNAYCDRVPVYIMGGNNLDATLRRPGIEWIHSALDGGAIVRDFTKWDDQPVSLGHFAESAIRAYKVAMTPPRMPVLLMLDGGLQEDPIAPEERLRLRIPKLTVTSPPQGDPAAVAEAARLLVAAENPLIMAGRMAHTPAGMARLIELAETLQAPVIDSGGRMNFPSRHPLNHSESGRQMVANADVILGLEITDFTGTLGAFSDSLVRTTRRVAKPNVKVISIAAGDLFIKANYQDFGRYSEVDVAMAADAEATLPALTEAVKRLVTADRKRVYEQRGKSLADAHMRNLDRARTDATYGWDASPITSSRLCAELWAQIRNEDWALVSDVGNISNWPKRLWTFDKHYQFIGGAGGGGVGYNAPASVGAALAHKKHGRLAINIQGDGDFMYAPGVWWTAAHHQIPLLTIMHNNRAYHQELMHVQRMANRHDRGVTTCRVGTTLDTPNIDYAKMAQSMGVHAEGPITSPADLGPAIRRSIEVVKRGEPALIDVVSQPR